MQEILHLGHSRFILGKDQPPLYRWRNMVCNYELCTRCCYRKAGISHNLRNWLQTRGLAPWWLDICRRIWQWLDGQDVEMPTYYVPEAFPAAPDHFICERCQSATYCSQTCQFMDWREHRLNCVASDDAEDSEGEMEEVD